MTQMLHGPAARAHDSFRHEAYLYSGSEDFVASTAAFVRDGVAAGQPVMVAVRSERLELLREALGADTDGVWFVDMAILGRNPAGIIPAWRGFIEAFSAQDQPLRGVGEPIWAGRRDAEIAEAQLHEALLNMAVGADTPLWLRCPYDITALDGDLVAHAKRSHPVFLDGDTYRGSTEYAGADLVDDLFSSAFGEAPPAAPCTPFGRSDYTALRNTAQDAASAAGVTDDRASALVLAVHEIATNSVRHGGGRGWLRTWTADGALVCEVRDRGVITNPLVGRTSPSPTQEGGRGVWLANQLCDLVQLRSGADGTVVRLVTWLDEPLRR